MEEMVTIPLKSYNFFFEQHLKVAELEFQIKEMKQLLLEKSYEDAFYSYDKPLEMLLDISGCYFGLGDRHLLFECGITRDEMYEFIKTKKAEWEKENE